MNKSGPIQIGIIAFRYSLFLIFPVIHTISSGQVNTSGETSKGTLLLKSGFENGISITSDMSDITGSDVTDFSWETTSSWIQSSGFVYLVNKGKILRDFMESYIQEMTGPYGNKTRVLCMVNKADDPDHGSLSRNEYSLFGKNSPSDYKEGYVRYWMKLQDNMEKIIPFDKEAPFYMIMEWKEPNSKIVLSREECKKCCNAGQGGTNNYRINIGLYKNRNSSELHWIIRSEQPQPCRIEEWRYKDEKIKFTPGKWFLVEAYMKKHPSSGRVYFAVDGQVVLDTDLVRPEGFTGRTQHKDNPMKLAFWSVMKSYHDMEWNRLGPVAQWYDDIELWSSFPPGHSALK